MSLIRFLQDANARVQTTRRAIFDVTSACGTTESLGSHAPLPAGKVVARPELYVALQEIEPGLADSYTQICIDLSDPDRVAFAGTAHEIRELLSTILRLLAPDNDVKRSDWYNSSNGDSQVSQKDRVRYVLRGRRAGSKETEVTEQLDLVEERVAHLIRSTYGRASDAAHRRKSRTEAKRLLNYFEAFAHDLLDLQ